MTRLSDDELAGVAAALRARCGVVLDTGMRALVEARLEPLAAELHLTLGQLARDLRAGAPWAERAVEALCNHETSFFRDVFPFELLRGLVAPLLAGRAEDDPVVVWSAAASTGQEAYSAAMLLHDALEGTGRRARVLATDVARDVLERARQGRYSQLEVNRGLPAPLLLRHFERRGLDWEVRGTLRATVEVSRLNLVDPAWPLLPPCDVVLLRNVLIYFDLDTRRAVLGRVRRVLRPGGALILGAAETTLRVDDGFEWVPAPGGGGSYRLRDAALEESRAVSRA